MNLKVNEKAYELLDTIETERKIIMVEGSESSACGEIIVLDIGVTDKTKDIGNNIKLGIMTAEAAMGRLGKIFIKDNKIYVSIPKYPSIATLSCQMAGWRLKIGNEILIGSGPAKIPAIVPKETINRIGYFENPEKAAFLLETNVMPNEETAKKILEKTKAKKVIVGAFRGDSMIGLINVLARVVEMGFYRMDYLKFDTNKAISGEGFAPIPKLNNDIMYTSNDALIYGADVTINVNGWDENLTDKISSSSSPAYGRPFKNIFTEAGGDFYKIDLGIFAPAKITIIDTQNNKRYISGHVNENIISKIL
ncbi:MAG: methenyltetrahydromethanopterin cyclohydrolase [Candidatus Altarchaeum sp.]|nr:methenyltetrahydromethanopterin cyclohydrolase [Candidatus Altarchaeum sp.]